jgi:hypothetical protein
MRRYFFGIVAVAATYLVLHFLVCLFFTAPISAEYWLRELIVIKRILANSIASPRIIFLGGSSALFSIDARQVEETTGIRAMNMGLHAGMRLEQMLLVGEDVVRPGDILVLILEPNFYSCDVAPWDDWQVTNALAWDKSYFNSLALLTRIGAIFSSGSPMLAVKIIASKFGSIIAPAAYTDRFQALAPIDVIWERYRSGKFRPGDFEYSAYNIDDRGDIQKNIGVWRGPGIPANEPSNVCHYTLSILANFVVRMKDIGVRVLVAHTPYLIEGAPRAGWQEAEANFSRDIGSTGATILDQREELFLPRAYFFNTSLHLNQVGRRDRTNIMVADLAKNGIGSSGQLYRGIRLP